MCVSPGASLRLTRVLLRLEQALELAHKERPSGKVVSQSI